MLRVGDGDKVRVVVVQHLVAGRTGAAGLIAALAENGLTQQLGQCLFAGALGPGDQIKMGDPAAVQTLYQILLQPFIAQQSVKAHSTTSAVNIG